VVAIAVWIAAAACLSPPVESPKTTVIQDTPVRVPQNAQNRVDVLFMVDNSPSMDAMQTELKARFGDFFKVFQDLAAGGTYADLHIGVVTSDYGAGDLDGQPGSGCFASPGGQKGVLQAIGAKAATGCMPPMNAPYIQYAFDPNGGTAKSNLPGGQDLVGTFTCMASVGAGGCGFEHQLESVYAALKNTRENAGFLRPDALLTVVFVTNEDDGSAAPSAKFYESGAPTSMYGEYDTYRQTRFAVDCGGNQIPYTDGSGNGLPMTLSGCASAPNPNMDTNLAFDISRYINLFTQPAIRGGVKTLPDDVILFGIDGPEAPVQTILATKNTGLGVPPNAAYLPCGPQVGGSCVMRLQHSCQNNVAQVFFADPSVRLNTVINLGVHHQVTSICGDDLNQQPNFTQALQTLGNLISSQISPGCIPALLPDLSNPTCVVEDITTNPDNTQTIHNIPECSSAGVFPCWKVEMKAQCNKIVNGKPLSPQGVGVTIDRNGMPAPDNTSASVECETTAAKM
jgi:hypothetical protein